MRATDHRADLRHYFRAGVQFRIRILPAPVCRDGVDVRLRLLNGDVRFQPRDAGEKIVVPLFGHWLRAIWRRLAQVRHRNPKFRRIRKPERIGKTRRHNPDHLELLTIERHTFADDAAISSESSLPQSVAQNDDTVSRFVFFRQKRATEDWLNSK